MRVSITLNLLVSVQAWKNKLVVTEDQNMDLVKSYIKHTFIMLGKVTTWR